jgi:hypothetical protein
MPLTITTTHSPATDLGYLLHKNPSRPQSFELAFGRADVFYPQADEGRCTAAMLLEIDPVGLVRNHHGPAGERFSLEQYVNDRPYAASSFSLRCDLACLLLGSRGQQQGAAGAGRDADPAVGAAERRPMPWGRSVSPAIVRAAGVSHRGHPSRARRAVSRVGRGAVRSTCSSCASCASAISSSCRRLAAKRSLAIREFALGIEALARFVRREPLRCVHECVFGVLALESEPVDPRL